MQFLLLFLILLLLSPVAYAGGPDKSPSKAYLRSPVASMPLWFYDAEENFRYPVPSQFDFAYIDKSGKVVIEGPFVDAGPFRNGKADVSLGFYGFIGGKWVVKSIAADLPIKAEVFKDGRIVEKGGQPSIEEALRILNPGFDRKHYDGRNIDSALSLSRALSKKSASGKLVPFKNAKTGLWGYKDESGKVFLSERFDFAGPFIDGVSRIKNTYSVRWKEAQAKYRQKHLKALNTPNVDEDRVPLNIHSSMGSVAYISDRGRLIVSLDRYQDGKDFSEGLAAVKRDGKWGFIDKTGSVSIDVVYDYATQFSGGLAGVCKDGLYGFIDSKGNEVIPFKFAQVMQFKNGLAPASLDGRHWGYITTSGAFAIQPKFLRCFPFSDGLALVMKAERQHLEEMPEEYKHFYRSALVLMRGCKFDQAKKAFRVVERLSPRSMEAEASEFICKHIIPKQRSTGTIARNYQFAKNQRLDRRIEALEEVLKSCPDFAWAKVKLAEAYLESKQSDRARAILVKLSDEQPNFMPANILMAKLLEGENEKEKAAAIRSRFSDFKKNKELFDEIQRLIPPQYY